MFEFEFYDNNVSLINKIIKFFLYYINYSEFNLENSEILYFGAYTIYTDQMSLKNQWKQSYSYDRFHP